MEEKSLIKSLVTVTAEGRFIGVKPDMLNYYWIVTNSGFSSKSKWQPWRASGDGFKLGCYIHGSGGVSFYLRVL